MNGDLMVEFDARAAAARTTRPHGAAVTVATRGYQHQVPFGVVEQDADGTGHRDQPRSRP